jgi:hypothetical protein
MYLLYYSISRHIRAFVIFYSSTRCMEMRLLGRSFMVVASNLDVRWTSANPAHPCICKRSTTPKQMATDPTVLDIPANTPHAR